MDGEGEWIDIKSRNILTLEERVRAIREYDRIPVYQKVADIMNCSAKQIRNIIQNRESILLYYASKTGDCRGSFTKSEDRMHKIDLLNRVMYEWISRTQSREDVGRISTKLIRAIALDVKNHIKIPSFYPNTVWLESFMQQYNMTQEDLISQRVYERSTEPKENLSLKISDIVDYVKYLRDTSERVPRNPVPQADAPRYDYKQAYAYSNHEDSDPFDGDAIDANDDDDEYDQEEEYKEEAEEVPRKVRRLESNDSGNSGGSHETTFIESYEDALRHLKPLEDFVLLEANFRAIGVISQLEAIFRNPQLNK